MPQIPITNGFYQSESLPLSNQRCVNLFPVIPQEPSLSEGSLFGTAGIEYLTSTGLVQQKNRGSWVKNGIPYFVNGSTLYSLDRSVDGDGIITFSTTALGTIEGKGRVSLANSPTQLMILVPGGKGYIYNEDAGTPFQEITDSDFRANGDPLFVVYFDTSFVCTTDEDKVIVSDVNDGLSWDALIFGSVESDPDSVVAPIIVNNQLYITGTVTTEGFSKIGGSGFPYQRNNVFLDKGCSAPFSLIKTNQTFFMLGKGKDEDTSIWQFNGNDYIRKSTDAIDALLNKASDTEILEAFAMYYAQNGRFFISFTVAGNTFVFDLASEKWHERASKIDNEECAWRVASIVTAYGLTIVGDCVDGRIGYLEQSLYSEYEENMDSFFTIQPFFNLDGISLPYLCMTMESGVGNDADPDPQVGFSKSSDGITFPPTSRLRSVGKKGEFRLRQVWRRNGNVDKMTVLKFSMSAKTKKVFIRLDTL